MSGTARLIGEEIELLADYPIRGPLPTTLLVSSSANEAFGYAPRKASANATGTQVLLATTSAPINLGSVTNSKYQLNPYFTGQTAPAAATLTAPATLVLNSLTSFLGTVNVKLVYSTNKVAYVAPREYITLVIGWADDIGGSQTYSNAVPITVFNNVQTVATISVAVFIPHSTLRSTINLVASVTNDQAADSITIYSSTVIEAVQIN